VSEKERAGAPAASRLTDIFEVKEDTEMPIFKKPTRDRGSHHPHAPGMMGVASSTPKPMMGGAAGIVAAPSTSTTTTASGDSAGATRSPGGPTGESGGEGQPRSRGGSGTGTGDGAVEGLRRRSSSIRPGSELRRRTSSLAALVASTSAAGAGVGPGGVTASGELLQLYPNRPPLPVIPVPIQILDEMPMPYVHMLFITLKCVFLFFILILILHCACQLT
jgi:hypothetical protein